MRRGLTLCLMVIIALTQAVAFSQVNKLTRVDESDNYDEVVYGVDKNNNLVSVGVTRTGSVLTFSILDGDFKPACSFVVKSKSGIAISEYHFTIYGIGNWDYSLCLVQGLLDDEDKWVANVKFGGNSGEEVIIDEDGEIYPIDGLDADGAYIQWIGDRWYLRDYHQFYTLRTKDRPSAVNEISEADAEHIKGIYTLDGVKIGRAEKGLYIINGKKVVK